MRPAPRPIRAVGVYLLWAALLFPAACDPYDPPPEAALEIPTDGKWYPDTPLLLSFSEAIDAASLSVTIWPHALDIEGDIAGGVEPIIGGCTPAMTSCLPAGEEGAGLSVALSDDGLTATITQGDVFLGREGVPHILVVEAGLSDLAGRPRRVESWFPFQVSPSPTEGFVEVPMNSGVATMTADLTDILPGVYLRMFLDMVVDEEGGATTIMATVAGLAGDYPPNTIDPDHIKPKLDGGGWTVLIEGTFTPLESGAFFLDTTKIDLAVKVLGLIPVELQGFRLEATFRPGGGPDGRDELEGFMSATQGYMGDAGDELELGAVGASWAGYGVFADAIDDGMPRLCTSEPCAVLSAGGGDCQLPLPWTPPAICP